MTLSSDHMRKMYRIWWHMNLLHRFHRELMLTYGISEYDRERVDRAAKSEVEPDHCIVVPVPGDAVAADLRDTIGGPT